MARTSRATRAAARAWTGRSTAGSETGGIRVGSTTDDREEVSEREEMSNGSGSSGPASKIHQQDDERAMVDGGESTEDIFQTAREEATTEAIKDTQQLSAEASIRGIPEEAYGDDDMEANGRRRTIGKKKSDVTDMIVTALRGLFGQLGIQLIEPGDEDLEETQRMGWADALCPRLARSFYVHGRASLRPKLWELLQSRE